MHWIYYSILRLHVSTYRKSSSGLSYYDNQLNDRATMTSNVIFDTVLRNKTPTAAQQYTKTHFPILQFYVNHHTAIKTPGRQPYTPSSHQNQQQAVINLTFCWPCIIMYHYNVTNLIHINFHNHFIVFWSSTCFGRQASIFRRHYTSRFWCELRAL
jgi:hypothetical protein